MRPQDPLILAETIRKPFTEFAAPLACCVHLASRRHWAAGWSRRTNKKARR